MPWSFATLTIFVPCTIYVLLIPFSLYGIAVVVFVGTVILIGRQRMDDHHHHHIHHHRGRACRRRPGYPRSVGLHLNPRTFESLSQAGAGPARCVRDLVGRRNRW
jgi:hypothetical protein